MRYGFLIALFASVASAQFSNATRLQSRYVASTAPTNAYVLTWNASSNQWEPAAVGAAGSVAFSAVGAGTNVNALVMGTGGSLAVSGSGTIAATSAPFSGVSAGTNVNALVIGTGGSLTISGSGSINATLVNGSTPGGTCTNQVATSISSSGVPTCGNVVNAMVTSIDAAAKLTGIAPSANGGTGNGFAKFSGPATSEKTFTLPNASATLSYTVASGAKALATGAISSATCTSAQTDTATGALTTDTIIANFNADPTAVTGYVPLTAGMLTIIVYPTADTFNAKVCNNTASSITPGAITLNWKVIR